MTYDLAIIGGGPAGIAAGVYAARKLLKTVFITEEFGGQSVVSEDIQNWIGTPHISGGDLAKALKTHLETYAGECLDIKEGMRVEKVEKNGETFTVSTNKGDSFEAKTILIATGADRRKLKVPGAEEFDQKGLTYCASCDGPLFTGLDVVVVGGGNAGFETAAQLLAYTKSVTLLDTGEKFIADPITVEKVLANPNMTAINNAETLEVLGEKMVTGLKYKDKKTNEEKMLDIKGVFIEIGLVPATGYLEGLIELDDRKRVVIDPWTQKTSAEGIWAAGDGTNIRYHQNNIAAGDAVKAIEDIYVALHAS